MTRSEKNPTRRYKLQTKCTSARGQITHKQLAYQIKLGWLVACLTSQQHASVSQGRICLDQCTCRHIEIEVADQTFYLIHSQYTDTGPTGPTADPITPGTWQNSHWSTNVSVTGSGMTRPEKIQRGGISYGQNVLSHPVQGDRSHT